jgi:hypothetical protein
VPNIPQQGARDCDNATVVGEHFDNLLVAEARLVALETVKPAGDAR